MENPDLYVEAKCGCIIRYKMRVLVHHEEAGSVECQLTVASVIVCKKHEVEISG